MVQPSRTCLSLLMISTLLILLGSVSARAQWAVYDLRMSTDEEASVNFVHYTGAYLVAPLSGGAASLIFTTETEGRSYAVAENAARFFVAANAAKRRAVVSAVASSGSSQSMYQASGPLNTTRSYTIRGQKSVAIVASDLYGQLMTSDDEHLASGPASDGSLGVVGVAAFRGFLRKDLSDRLDAEAPTMSQAVDVITTLLQKYGYQSESESDTRPLVDSSILQPPVPPAPTADVFGAEGSLFPPGSREEMEKTLLQQSTK
ncbi:MAG: hypothetical protein JWO94_2792 [Verrucomicrobiaceae bacterium]|nr:hypothetical protein [Verrucomicrobiaceae bacterium]